MEIPVLRLRCLALFAVVCGLGGCYSGPADSVVETAVRARIAQTHASSPEVAVTVNSVTVQRCRRVGDDRFTCTIEVEMDIARAGHLRASGYFDMLKVPGGWTYDPNKPLQLRGH